MLRKVNLLFLDIDGCVNHNQWYYRNRVVKKNWDCGDADPKVIERLNSLSDLDVKVVISSSWGKDADKLLYDNGLRLPIIGHTEHFYNEWIVRGNEIEKWLYEHLHVDYDDFNYVIFDDDTDFLLKQKNNFIHINPQRGITDRHIEKARKIFLEK